MRHLGVPQPIMTVRSHPGTSTQRVRLLERSRCYPLARSLQWPYWSSSRASAPLGRSWCWRPCGWTASLCPCSVVGVRCYPPPLHLHVFPSVIQHIGAIVLRVNKSDEDQRRHQKRHHVVVPLACPAVRRWLFFCGDRRRHGETCQHLGMPLSGAAASVSAANPADPGCALVPSVCPSQECVHGVQLELLVTQGFLYPQVLDRQISDLPRACASTHTSGCLNCRTTSFMPKCSEVCPEIAAPLTMPKNSATPEDWGTSACRATMADSHKRNNT